MKHVSAEEQYTTVKYWCKRYLDSLEAYEKYTDDKYTEAEVEYCSDMLKLVVNSPFGVNIPDDQM